MKVIEFDDWNGPEKLAGPLGVRIRGKRICPLVKKNVGTHSPSFTLKPSKS